MFRRYDEDGNGTIDYKEFSAAMSGVKVNLKGEKKAREALDALKEAIRARGGEQGVRKLRTILKEFDTNGDNRFDYKEFKLALKELGVEATDDDQKKLFKLFDRNGDDQVSTEEFFSAIQNGISGKRKELVSLAFNVLDKSRDGKVTLEEIASRYDVSTNADVIAGKITPADALQQFMSSWGASIVTSVSVRIAVKSHTLNLTPS
jgi:Ca2+-binding EF-hand superfamily protein